MIKPFYPWQKAIFDAMTKVERPIIHMPINCGKTAFRKDMEEAEKITIYEYWDKEGRYGWGFTIEDAKKHAEQNRPKGQKGIIMSEQENAMLDKYKETALVLQKQVVALVVVDEMSFKKMQSMEQTAKANVKALEDHIKPQIEEANRRHKKLTQLRKDLTSPHKEVAAAARAKCIAYAEKERKKAAEEAAKIAREQQKATEQARLDQAARLEAEGQSEAAEKVLDAPAMPAPVVPVKETVKVKGATTRIKAEIVDFQKIVEHWAKNGVPVLTDKQKAEAITLFKFNDLARACGPNTENMLPGLKAVSYVS